MTGYDIYEDWISDKKKDIKLQHEFLLKLKNKSH